MHQLLRVETDKSIYEIQFGQIQFEITGRCNLKCQHCRAVGEMAKDVELSQIEKIMIFGRMFSPSYAEVIVSGGEPLMHRKFLQIMELVRQNGGESVTLTTNGILLNRPILNFLRNLEFKRLMLSVSLDSIKPKEHNWFRGCQSAYKKARKAIDLMVEENLPNTTSSVRMTLRPEQLSEMEDMATFIFNTGCQRVNFSSIHPSGRAIEHPELWMNWEQLKQFVETIFRLQKIFPSSFQIGTNDPLKCLLRKHHDIGGEGEIVFDGCAAGAATFNISANGDMTPCALMDLPIMNIRNLTVEQMIHAYQNNSVIKNLLEMNIKGKCGSCSLKFQCGGCRARALVRYGDYLGEDPCCWK